MMEEESSLSTTTSSLLYFLIFTSSILTFYKSQKQKEKKQKQRWKVKLKNEDDKNHDLTYDQVIQLRNEYYSKSCSVSYSNSGPLMIVGGKGSYLIDHNQKPYLDTRNNVAHVGHQNQHVINSITRQLNLLNTNSRYLHPNSVLLAKRLVENTTLPKELCKVFFVNSGSEANDLALRLAKASARARSRGNASSQMKSGCYNLICVENAYHGHTISTLDVSPYKFCKSKEYKSQLKMKPNGLMTPADHVYQVPCPDTYRGRYFKECRMNNVSNNSSRSSSSISSRISKNDTKLNCDDDYDYAKDVEEACNYYLKRNETVCAFIIEGGMSVGGVILPPPSYLQRCVDAVRKAGGVYIADEVQTGFGRLGSCYWAFQYNKSNVVPDIITVGKPFGNGMPLAAVITTKEISDAFESMDVEYFNTFGGNPVSCAAGLAVLDEIEKKDLQNNAYVVGNYLISKFILLQKHLPIIGDIRGSGLFIGIDLIKDRNSLEPATKECSFICTTLKEKYAILTSIDGPYDNVLVVKPPLTFSKDDADIFVNAFESCVVNDLSKVDLQTISLTPT